MAHVGRAAKLRSVVSVASMTSVKPVPEKYSVTPVCSVLGYNYIVAIIFIV